MRPALQKLRDQRRTSDPPRNERPLCIYHRNIQTPIDDTQGPGSVEPGQVSTKTGTFDRRYLTCGKSATTEDPIWPA